MKLGKCHHDLTVSVEDQEAKGDLVRTRLLLSGTDRGGARPSARPSRTASGEASWWSTAVARTRRVYCDNSTCRSKMASPSRAHGVLLPVGSVRQSCSSRPIGVRVLVDVGGRPRDAGFRGSLVEACRSESDDVGVGWGKDWGKRSKSDCPLSPLWCYKRIVETGDLPLVTCPN